MSTVPLRGRRAAVVLLTACVVAPALAAAAPTSNAAAAAPWCVNLLAGDGLADRAIIRWQGGTAPARITRYSIYRYDQDISKLVATVPAQADDHGAVTYSWTTPFVDQGTSPIYRVQATTTTGGVSSDDVACDRDYGWASFDDTVFAGGSSIGTAHLLQGGEMQDGGQPMSGTGDQRDPAYSPDGRWIAYSANPPTRVIMLRRADGTGTPTVLAQDDTSLTQPAWSPDGHRIAYTRSGQPTAERPNGPTDLAVVDVFTKATAAVPGTADLANPDWLSDTQLVAEGSGPDDGKALTSVGYPGGQRTSIPGTVGGHDVAPSHDGRRLAFIRKADGAGRHDLVRRQRHGERVGRADRAPGRQRRAGLGPLAAGRRKALLGRPSPDQPPEPGRVGRTGRRPGRHMALLPVRVQHLLGAEPGRSHPGHPGVVRLHLRPARPLPDGPASPTTCSRWTPRACCGCTRPTGRTRTRTGSSLPGERWVAAGRRCAGSSPRAT